MNRSVIRCSIRIQQLPFIPYVGLFLLLSIAAGLPQAPRYYLQGDWTEYVSHAPLLVFLLICIVAPLLFALMFQRLPMALFKDYSRHKNILTAAFSAIVYAAATYTTPWHIANSLLMGLTFVLCYLGYQRHGAKVAFCAITAVYLLRNLMIFFSMYYNFSLQNSFILPLIKNLL
jgi:hypothetical protein